MLSSLLNPHAHNPHHCRRWRSTQVAECRDARCIRSGELLHARSATRVLDPRRHGAVVLERTLVRDLRDPTPPLVLGLILALCQITSHQITSNHIKYDVI